MDKKFSPNNRDCTNIEDIVEINDQIEQDENWRESCFKLMDNLHSKLKKLRNDCNY